MTNLNDLFKAAADEKKRLKEEKENPLPVKAIKQPQQKIAEPENLVAAAMALLNADSFQQPAPRPIDQNLSAITKKLQFLEQSIGKIAALGAGSGEVNLRWLDDVDRSTIANGLFLKYNSTKNKFEFANPVESADHSIYATVSYVNGLKDRIVSPNDTYATFIDNTGTTTSAGNIVPGANTHTLGTAAIPWKDIYISQGSLYIGDVNPAVDAVSLKNTSGYIVVSRGGLKVTDNTDTYEIFQLDSTGKLILKSEQPLATTTPAVSLIGNLSGNQLPTSNLGVMLQATGTQDQPSRIYLDGIGVQSGGANAYAAFIGRSARGSASSPTQSRAGDIIARFGGNAYATTLGVNSISNVRIDMVATDNQTSTNRGSRLEFWTTPSGSVVPERSAHIDSAGIDLSEATDVNAGITFKNGSLLKYWPSVTGNNTKILRTDGTNFFWDSETVVAGQVIFKGDWSAANPPGGGTPTISNATGSAGWQYIVNAAGTQNLGSGNITFAIGDLVIHNGTRYVKIDGTTPQVQSNWTESNSALPAFILNKPTLATVATSGSYLDLSNRPTIPAAQIQSDWTQSNNANLDFIKNKPVVASANTANAIVVRDASGDFSAGTISATRLSLAAGTTTVAPLKFTAGDYLSTPVAGTIEYDGNMFYTTPQQATRGMIESKQVYINKSQKLLQNSGSQQTLLDITNGVAVSYGKRYKFKIMSTVRVVANNVNLFFAIGGTATYYRCKYQATVGKGTYGPGMMPTTVVEVTGSADGQVKNTINISQGGAGGTYFNMTIEGTFDTQYSGYCNPIVLLSPNPGYPNSYVVEGAYMEVYPIGDAITANNNTVIGNWS